MLRGTFALVTGFLLFLSAAEAQKRSLPHPDFSGTWEMDSSRSESAHQDVPIGPVSLTILQTPADLRIETRKQESPSSPVVTEKLLFLLNGTEQINTTGESTTVKARAHWDGLKLIAETEREINGATVTTSQVFRFGASPNEIVIDKTLTIQHGYQSPGAPKTSGSGKDVFVRAKR